MRKETLSDIISYAESLGAVKYVGYTGSRKNVYTINVGSTFSTEATFELGENKVQTLHRMLYAIYLKGVEIGKGEGKEELQKVIRNALGVRERRTDGHNRTCVIGDYDD